MKPPSSFCSDHSCHCECHHRQLPTPQDWQDLAAAAASAALRTLQDAYVGTTKDIEERAAAVASLAREEERLLRVRGALGPQESLGELRERVAAAERLAVIATAELERSEKAADYSRRSDQDRAKARK